MRSESGERDAGLCLKSHVQNRSFRVSSHEFRGQCFPASLAVWSFNRDRKGRGDEHSPGVRRWQ
jgi:hypothetical protein